MPPKRVKSHCTVENAKPTSREVARHARQIEVLERELAHERSLPRKERTPGAIGQLRESIKIENRALREAKKKPDARSEAQRKSDCEKQAGCQFATCTKRKSYCRLEGSKRRYAAAATNALSYESVPGFQIGRR